VKAVHLSRKLVLEAATRVPDGAGGYTDTWAALGTVWADVRAGYGREREGVAATISYVTYRIVVRSSPVGAVSRPKPDQRFREGMRVYQIVAVTEFDPGSLYLECFTKEEVSA